MAREAIDNGPALTPKALLNLCNLTNPLPQAVDGDGVSEGRTTNGQDEQQRRLQILKRWQSEEPKRLAALLVDRSSVDPKTGCFPLHWAAGTAFDEALSFLLTHCCDCACDCGSGHLAGQQEEENDEGGGDDEPTTRRKSNLLVDQLAMKPSTGRTPLHYAARNGHLSTCQLLIEKFGANPNAKCHRGCVTPIQLAVWQNRLNIVKYLVQINQRINPDLAPLVLECNDFACGLNHWIGLIPKHRWRGDDTCNDGEDDDDGSGVLHLARYLHDQGVSYTSTPNNQQNQGHTPLHKAAWGGNVALMEYYREEHGVYDTIQDSAGNYAADLANMNGQQQAVQWLHQQGSLARQESCTVLGLPVTATKEEIQARYKMLARQYHPDKLQQQQQRQQATATAVVAVASADNNDNNNEDAFVRIKAAYEHLIHQGGAGCQRNPKHEALRLLTMEKKKEEQDNSDQNSGQDDNTNDEDKDDDDLFHARILAVISDYGDKGFPISAIARRWNQIWPDRPFPSPENYIIQVPSTTGAKAAAAAGTDGASTTTTTTTTTTKMIPKRVRLLKFLKYKCQSVVMFRKINGVELAFQRIQPNNNKVRQQADQAETNQKVATTESQ